MTFSVFVSLSSYFSVLCNENDFVNDIIHRTVLVEGKLFMQKGAIKFSKVVYSKIHIISVPFCYQF